MANYNSTYYDEVDEVFSKFRTSVFEQPVEDPLPYDTINIPLAPVGWVENADATDGEAKVIINADGITVIDGKINVLNGAVTIIEDGVVRQVENEGADVTIDENGITILNGAINIEDYSGSTVLTAAGFGGSWVDFIASGVYNGLFRAPVNVTNSTTTTMVNSGEGADYIPSLSSNVPYWIIEAITGTGRYSVLDDGSFGRAFQVSKSGAAAGSVRISADAPVTDSVGNVIDLQIPVNFIKGEAAQADSIEIYLTELDKDHVQIAGGMDFVLHHTIDDEATVAEVNKIYVDRIDLETATRFLRVHIKFILGATGAVHTGTQSMYGLFVLNKPLVTDQVYIGGGISFPTESLGYTYDIMTLTPNSTRETLTLTTAGLNAGVADFQSAFLGIQRGNASQNAVIIGQDVSDGAVIRLGSGSAATDVELVRSGTNILTLSSPGVLRLATTTDVSPSSTGHAFQIGSSTGVNLRMDGNEIQGASNGSASVLHLQNDGGGIELGNASASPMEIAVNQNFMSFVEITSPAAPAANTVRLYARDSGAGKTQLIARFATGAVQIVAAEP